MTIDASLALSIGSVVVASVVAFTTVKVTQSIHEKQIMELRNNMAEEKKDIEKRIAEENEETNERLLQVQTDAKIACTEVATAAKLSMERIEKRSDEHIETLKELLIQRFKSLEEKQDKHNSLIERMVVVEQSAKSFHTRLDDICDFVGAPRRNSRKEKED